MSRTSTRLPETIMRIYLDVSCLNRPFDDQNQRRIRLEAEAVTLVLDECEKGEWEYLSSQIATIEIDATPDEVRRSRVSLLLPTPSAISSLIESHFQRAEELEGMGFKPADALHVASAEDWKADVLLSCDDRFCRLAKRRKRELLVKVAIR